MENASVGPNANFHTAKQCLLRQRCVCSDGVRQMSFALAQTFRFWFVAAMDSSMPWRNAQRMMRSSLACYLTCRPSCNALCGWINRLACSCLRAHTQAPFSLTWFSGKMASHRQSNTCFALACGCSTRGVCYSRQDIHDFFAWLLRGFLRLAFATWPCTATRRSPSSSTIG
jgi:hypothetical protein